MSLIPRLAAKSLRSRLLTTTLTVASIALSVTLLVGIEHVRAGVRESFAGTIRGTDLIVGARGGTLQVLLSTVFGIGSPAGSVNLSTFERWKAHPAVKWAVPYSLGDSHRGFRVVGTTDEFFQRYRFRDNRGLTFVEGHAPATSHEVAIGSEVAEKLRYGLGAKVTVTHGLRDIGTSNHEAHPFTVVGILGRSFTPIDRSVYMTLDGIDEMHEDEPVGGPGSTQEEGAANGAASPGTGSAPVAMPGASPPVMPGASPPPAMPGATPPSMPGASPPAMPGASPPPAAMPGASPPVMPGATPPVASSAGTSPRLPIPGAPTERIITSFFVGTKNRFEALMLQREMNTDLEEPLTAVIPGVALGELYQNIGSAEVGLRVIAIFAVAIGLSGMLVSLYSSLDARRREMAILRSVGAGPGTIITLLVIESGLLALLGCIIGVALVYAGLVLGQGPIEQRFGLHLAITPLGATEWTYLAVTFVAGVVIGFVPAIRAYRTSLADGLSPRT